MSVLQPCLDTKDVLDLFRPQDLYLKPIARINISVQLPQLRKAGAKISNWEVMERVKEMAKPFTCPVFKVSKSSLDFIRFEAEIDNIGSMDQVIAKLDMKTIKLSGFQDLLKVRAAEAKPPFPSRSDWDSFFRDNKSMNEMKPGERPDTLHLQNLPTKWFINQQDRSGVARNRPSETVLKKVFGTFGEIRVVDIPILDPYREKMKSSISGIQTFSFGQDLVFEAYVQFKEYIGFVKAMNSLKGMKLLYKDRYEDRAWVANIKVDFDKAKHLSETTIKKREEERDRLRKKEMEKEDAERKKKELEELKRSEELRRMDEEEREKERQKVTESKLKEKRRLEREERRRLKKAKNVDDEDAMARKIAVEETKLLIAQRKLESIRLLDELLQRVKAKMEAKDSVRNLEADLLKAVAKEARARSTGKKPVTSSLTSCKEQDEKALRDKLISRLKDKESRRVEYCGQKIRSVLDEGLEDISDDQTEPCCPDDLRLTSTDEDEETPKKRAKKEKKAKKKKEKKKKRHRRRSESDGDPDHEDENDEKTLRRRELDSHITMAKRISARERRSRSREARPGAAGGVDDAKPYKRKICRVIREDIEERWVSPSTRQSREDAIRERRAAEAEQRRLEKRTVEKASEVAKEEAYDRMMNPHLYFQGDVRPSFRKLKAGEHYEDVQKRELERQIFLRERELRDEGAGRGYERHPRDRREIHDGGGPHHSREWRNDFDRGYDRDRVQPRGGRDEGGRRGDRREDWRHDDHHEVRERGYNRTRPR